MFVSTTAQCDVFPLSRQYALDMAKSDVTIPTYSCLTLESIFLASFIVFVARLYDLVSFSLSIPNPASLYTDLAKVFSMDLAQTILHLLAHRFS